MNGLKRFWVTSISLLSLIGVGIGIRCAMQSSLFLIQTVEVQSSVDDPPVADATVLKLAGIPVGKLSLFALDLKGAENRLLTNAWIKEVKFRKTLLPNQATLIISVVYRKPEAIVVLKDKLVYVDVEGRTLGAVSLLNSLDLPVLTGFGNQGPNKMREAINLIHRWEESRLNQLSNISSAHWDQGSGYRMLVTYGGQIHTVVELGHEIDEDLDSRLNQLHNVFHYLKENSIAARRIWADAGKKVVVKTAHGS